jgi:hypothetical protein
MNNRLKALTFQRHEAAGSSPEGVSRSHLSRGETLAPALAGTPHLFR